MTRQLLTALNPVKKLDDNYTPARDIEDDFEEMEYPTGLLHLLKILFKTDEKKLLSLSNPDGYFYLFYIKTCIKLFASIIALSSV